MSILERIVKTIRSATDAGSFAYIAVTIPNLDDAEERIIFPPSAADTKIEYIRQAYDENGVHRGCKQIRILEAGKVERADMLPIWNETD